MGGSRDEEERRDFMKRHILFKCHTGCSNAEVSNRLDTKNVPEETRRLGAHFLIYI